MLGVSDESRTRLMGSGRLVLNVFRAFNILGLVAVAVSSWILIVMAGLTGNFYFFEAASHFFNSLVAGFLIISEIGLFRRYFASTWPVLSPYHGLSWLGTAMVVMGCHVLGNLNRRAVTSDNLGGHIYRSILASGVLAITFGFCNIVATFLFRDSANGITARNVRSQGADAEGTAGGSSSRPMSSTSFQSCQSVEQDAESIRHAKGLRRLTAKFGFNKGGGGNARKSRISMPFDFRSGHDAKDDGDDDSDVENNADMEKSNYDVNNDRDKPYPDSNDEDSDDNRDDRRSPIMPEVARPPTAMHPAYSRHTQYSEASYMNRF